MPSGEEIQRYLTGAWRMMLGRPDGLKLLDLSADGFWNSFFAMVVALPPLVVSWVGFANNMPEMGVDFDSRLSIVLRLALIDFSTWVVPLAALAAVVRPAGLADRFVHIVVSGNWGSTLLAWIMIPPSILELFLPEANEFNNLLSLIFFVIAMVLSWRITNAAIGRGAAITTAVFAGMFVVSLLSVFILQPLLGLVPLA